MRIAHGRALRAQGGALRTDGEIPQVDGRALRILLAAAGGCLAALVLAQLVLPGLAAQRVRDQLRKYGTLRSVSVSAFPAVELLWGSGDSVKVSASSLSIGPTQAIDELWRARGIDRMEIRAEDLQIGPLKMTGATIEERGGELQAQGSVRQSALQGVLPGDFEVQPEVSEDGEVRVRASGSLFGVRTSVQAVVSAQEGKLVAQPEGFLFAGLARITLFSDQRLLVQGVSLIAQSGAGEDTSYLLRIWGKLH
jgi:LmeA-like phospholipid-binding